MNQTDKGRALSGSHSSANDVYVDGVRVISGVNFPSPVEPPSSESYAATEESPFKEVWQQPLSTFSVDVDHASYSNIRRMIENGDSIPPDAVRIEEMLNYFDYDYPAPQDDAPFAIHSELSSCPWNENSQLLALPVQVKAKKLAKSSDDQNKTAS